jgi:GT2 family glycosyltransferase
MIKIIKQYLKYKKEKKIISNSTLFDERYYLISYPDVIHGDVDALKHYVKMGASEGRNPNNTFDASFYINEYEDVKNSELNPLVHYIIYGQKEARPINQHQAEKMIIHNSDMFDEEYYYRNYQDVKDAGINPITHYLKYGTEDERNPSGVFNTAFYLNEYEDVRDSGVNPLLHYIRTGKKEGRFQNQYLKDIAIPVREELIRRNSDIENRPLISIIMPTYNPPKEHLWSAVESVISQVYENWELCICDDGSGIETKELLSKILSYDKRIKVSYLDKNSGISKATNKALNLAEGEFIALLDHDDSLMENSLLEIIEAINIQPDVDVIYTDQDKIDDKDNLSEPFFKPDWSPEMFRGVMYVGHLLVVRREVALKVGGFNSKYDKIQDYDFMLRIAEQTNKIKHIPKILYHWRKILQAAAVNDSHIRQGLNAKAEVNSQHEHRVILRPLSRENFPMVSIIVPTKDAPEHIQRCLSSIFEKTTYTNYEVVVVDNGTVDERALETLEKYEVNVISYNEKFNYSHANNLGVRNCKGEFIILLNNDTEVITPDWIENLLYYLEQDDVGIVGPLLAYPDRTVQHAGVVLGFRGTADHVMRGFPIESDGYAGSLSCTREVSAVTAACLMIRKDEYEALGGFEEYYATHYQDVDFCLRVISKGKRILFVPHIELIHYESVSRKSYYDLVDRALLLDSWGDLIEAGDPYYNQNFSLEHYDYSVRMY